MKTVIPFLCVGTVVSSTPGDIRLTLTRDREDRLFASVTVPLAERPISNMALTIYDESYVTTDRSSEPGLSYMFFTDSRNVSRDFRVDDGSLNFFPEPDGTGTSYLGIGGGSGVTQSSGSVAVLKDGNRAQLVLGQSFEVFNSSCLPDSLISFNMTDMERWQESAIRLSGERVGTYRIRFQSSRGYRAGIPANIFNRLVNIVTGTGAVQVPVQGYGIAIFRYCRTVMYESLPIVEIGLGQNRIAL